jgi:hypothetical protein
MKKPTKKSIGKFFFTALVLCSSLAKANFGGELVNPRTVPESIPGSKIHVNIPENWSVSRSAGQINASEWVIASDERKPSQLKVVMGATPRPFNQAQCSAKLANNVTRTICVLENQKIQVTLQKGVETVATMNLEQGSSADSKTVVENIAKSLRIEE